LALDGRSPRAQVIQLNAHAVDEGSCSQEDKYDGYQRNRETAAELIKAKFHYASWFGAGSELASVMEFGFNQ